MSNATPPSSLRATAPASGSPLRGTLKGVLATLVLLLLALLFWQLLDQLQQTRKDQRQHAIDYNADLAEHISLNLALNAQIALNLLPIIEPPQNAEQQQLLLKKLQLSLPDLQSIALLDAKGQLISDSDADGQDAAWLAELTSRSRGRATTTAMPATARWSNCCCTSPAVHSRVTGCCAWLPPSPSP